VIGVSEGRLRRAHIYQSAHHRHHRHHNEVPCQADEACDTRKAKSPSGMANAVEEGLNYLGALVGIAEDEYETYGNTYATETGSNSSPERSHSRSTRLRKQDRKPSWWWSHSH